MSHDVEMHHVSEHVIRLSVPLHHIPLMTSMNMYVIYSGSRAIIIDCGCETADICEKVVAHIRSLGIEKVEGYLVTHYHLDHTQGLRLFESYFPAPMYVHQLDAAKTAEIVGCSVKTLLTPPPEMRVGNVTVLTQHQPGHTHGHIHAVVRPDDVIVVGDHMSGIGTVWIGPPDGHMKDYYKALQAIHRSDTKFALPGHGPVVANPHKESMELYEHRLSREKQIYAYLQETPRCLNDIVSHIYQNRTVDDVFRVARRTVQAHLANLMEDGYITGTASAPDFITYYRQVEA